MNNTMVRIAFFAALMALIASCEFFKENDLLEDLKKDPPIAGADTEVPEQDDPQTDDLIDEETDTDDPTTDADNVATCGNGTVDGTEECDSSTGTASIPCPQLDGALYGGGDATCNANCIWDRTNCVPASCGNGTVDGTEECEEGQMRPCDEIDVKYSDGQADCNPETCKWILDDCVENLCGNGTINQGEVCEINQTKNCAELGFVGSAETAGCKPDCSGWDMADCQNTSPECGDGSLEGDEVCEIGQTKNCAELGYSSATTIADCLPDCTGWDTAECSGVKVAFNFYTSFIFDVEKMGDMGYVNTHMDGVITTGIFSGTWEGDTPIPPAEATMMQGYVIRDGNAPTGPRLIVQEMYLNAGQTFATPAAIALHFPTDNILGDGTLGLPITFTLGLSEQNPKLFIALPVGSNNVCTKYVAPTGSFKVTDAEDTMETDGGILGATTNGQHIAMTEINTSTLGEQLQIGYSFGAVCGVPNCGDGIVQNGEDCDISEMVAFDCAKLSTQYTGGTATCGSHGLSCRWNFEECTGTACGNGIKEGAEECDDGAAQNGTYGHCNSDCTAMGPHCGDNNTDAGHEVCDDGNDAPGDGCSANCKFIDSTCTAITAGEFVGQPSMGGQPVLFAASFTPAEGDARPDYIFFFVSENFLPAKNTPYSFATQSSDYGAQAIVDYDGGSSPLYFAAYGGQFLFYDYNESNPPLSQYAQGELQQVYFGEIDTAGGGWVIGGQCRYLDTAAWNTMPQPTITDLRAAYNGTDGKINILWTAPDHPERYNQYRVCYSAPGVAGTCDDVMAGMSPGGTEIRELPLPWYNGNATVSVTPRRNYVATGPTAEITIDTNAKISSFDNDSDGNPDPLDFGTIPFNDAQTLVVTVTNTSTVVDLVLNNTSLAGDCGGAVTILSGEVTTANPLKIQPGSAHELHVRYAPTAVSSCGTTDKLSIEWLVSGGTHNSVDIPLIGNAINTPPVITSVSISKNPLKNSEGPITIEVIARDGNNRCGENTDIAEYRWDRREVGGTINEYLPNPTCTADPRDIRYYDDIMVASVPNGIYVIPVTVVDSAGQTAKKNISFAIFSGSILAVGSGKPYGTIGVAAANFVNGDIIVVHPGTYMGTANTGIIGNGKNLLLYGIAGPEETTIDLSATTDRVAFEMAGGVSDSIIGGFTVKNGQSGAVSVNASPNPEKLLLTNCRFENNSKGSPGGGAAFVSGSQAELIVRHSKFLSNSVGNSHFGGAVFAQTGAKVSFFDVIFSGNSAGGGGAVYTGNITDALFDRVVFTGNTVVGGGGAAVMVYNHGTGVIEFRNAVIYGNEAIDAQAGALLFDGITSYPPTVRIFNSTIAHNTAEWDGGGIVVMRGDFRMKDTILYGNQAGPDLTSQLVIYDDGPAPAEVTAWIDNCLFGGGPNPVSDTGNRINDPEGLWSTTRYNKTGDPLFVGVGDGVMKYRLQSTSPCTDTGSNSGTVPTYDFLGYSRYNNNDIGAFEYQP